MQLSVLAGISALCLSAAFGVASAASDDTPKLPGTAAGFAGVPWGSSGDTIKATLAQRGYAFAEVDEDGDLVFTASGQPVAHVFEVLDTSKHLVKTLISLKPDASNVIDDFHTLRQTLVAKYGQPSLKYEDYTGQYRGATDGAQQIAAIGAGDGNLGAFWMYKDGSNIYLHVGKDLTIEAAYESPKFKAEQTRRDAAAAVDKMVAGAAPAAAPKSSGATIFVGPPGWAHTQGPSSGLGTWTRSGDNGYSENISVEAKDGYATLDALLQAEVNYIGGLPDQFGYAPTDITLCGNHPAKYLSYTYTGPTGLPITTEVVIAVFGKTAYSAKYNKSISQDADAAAEHAIGTLCGAGAR